MYRLYWSVKYDNEIGYNAMTLKFDTLIQAQELLSCIKMWVAGQHYFHLIREEQILQENHIHE